MPKPGQSDATGTPTARCGECGWTWTLEPGQTDPESCPSCGNLTGITVSVPKLQRSKKQQY